MCSIIIDFKPVLRDWSFNIGMSSLYKYYPLRDILTSILYMKAYEDHNELFWLELEQRSPDYEQYDFHNLEFTLDLLVQDIDLHIHKTLSGSEEYAEYVLSRWLTETSAILTRDLHVGYYQYSQPANHPFAKDKLILDPRNCWLG